MSKHVHARRTPLWIALAGALSLPPVMLPLVPATAYAQAQPFNIAAGPLDRALSEFAAAAGVTFSTDGALTRGKQSSGLNGAYSVDEGFLKLLSGSGLEAVRQSNGTYTLSKLPEEAAVLPAVNVTANADSNATSRSSSLNYLSQEQKTGVLGSKPILDTPFSISVVDEKEIKERGATSVGQIFVNDAGVYTPSAAATTDWWGAQIRGLPVRNFYVDDVPMALFWGGDFPLEAVESVTALKGLGGFMYGFGAPGGAISYTLKRPLEVSETTVNVGYRNPSLYSVHVDANQVVTNDFAIRANIATENGTAYNETRQNSTLGSLAFEKKFSDSGTWSANIMYEQNSKDDEPFLLYLWAYDVEGARGKLPKVTYDYDDINVENSFYDTETLVASTDVQWQLNQHWGMEYKIGISQKHHRSNKTFAALENVDGDYQGYTYNFAEKDYELFNQLMLTGEVMTGSVRHEIVGGVGQSSGKIKQDSNGYAAFTPNFTGNLYQEQTFLIDGTPAFDLTPKAGIQVTQNYVFLSDTTHYNEHWQTIIGVRFTDYDAEDDPNDDNDPLADESGYQTQETSPTLALIYKPNEQTSIYGSYVEGLEPGSTVGETYQNAGEVLDATVSKQYEMGIKHESGKIDYTAALFRVERVNERTEDRGAARLFYTQDGLMIYDGVEVGGAYQFTRDLNVGLSVVYLDASVEDVSVGSEDIEGNAPGFAPEWQGVVNAAYRVAAIDGLKLHGNVRYFGESYTDDTNVLIVPDRTVVNAGFSYDLDVSEQAWTLYGNIYNLLDEEYWAGGGFGNLNVGEARNVSLSLSTTF